MFDISQLKAGWKVRLRNGEVFMVVHPPKDDSYFDGQPFLASPKKYLYAHIPFKAFCSDLTYIGASTADIVVAYEPSDCGGYLDFEGLSNHFVRWSRYPYSISRQERELLRAVDKKYTWITRDEDGQLYLYKNAPIKHPHKDTWHWCDDIYTSFPYNALFPFVTYKNYGSFPIEPLSNNLIFK